MGGVVVVVAVVESSMILYSKVHIRRNFSENLKSSFVFITRTPVKLLCSLDLLTSSWDVFV